MKLKMRKRNGKMKFKEKTQNLKQIDIFDFQQFETIR